MVQSLTTSNSLLALDYMYIYVYVATYVLWGRSQQPANNQPKARGMLSLGSRLKSITTSQDLMLNQCQHLAAYQVVTLVKRWSRKVMVD